MKNIFKFKSIKTKVLFGFSVVMVVVFLLSLVNILSMNNMRKDSQEVIDKELPLLIQDEYLSYNMIELRALINKFLLYGDQRTKDELMVVIDQGEEIEDEILSKGNIEAVQKVIKEKGEWESILLEAVDEYEAGNKEKALILIEGSEEEAEQLNKDINDLTVNRENKITESGNQTIQYAKYAIIFSLVITGLTLLISIVAALITSRSISRPVIRVMERMNEVAKGVLNLDPLKVTTNDETARLTEATNTMTENNRELLLSIQEVSETVSSQSEELTQSASEVKSATEQVATTMEELAAGTEVQANSASDLTDIMGVFSEKIDHTNSNSTVVQNNSGEVLKLTGDGSELMRSSTEQMDKINVLVHESVTKMNSLNQHAQDITKIVAVINEIAEQTNLLALNAAIEAARAGENGKGFAVVADEVRKLAEQVGLSIKDITQIVDDIQKESKNVTEALENGYSEVEQGSNQIQATSETFKDISTQVGEMVVNIQTVTENLNDIVANNEQMAKSIEEIASVAEESAAGVQQTAASAEEASSSMEEVAGSSSHLANLAEELNTLVARYKL